MGKNVRIVHILQSIDNASAGPTYSVGSLCEQLAARGHQVKILSLGKTPAIKTIRADTHVFSGFLARYGLPPWEAIKYCRQQTVKSVDVMHGHGVWSVANLFPLVLKQKQSPHLVWSPRGMFTPWSWNYKKWKKQPFWYVLQRPALRAVSCFHATAESEAEDIRRLGFWQPIAVIPNGVNLPRRLDKKRGHSIVFLSRIHVKKGLHLLLDAWKTIAAEFQEWNLKIGGGPDSAYAMEMREKVRRDMIPRVEFVGEILGNDKDRFLRSARLMVLPTYSENFGIVVAEALANGTPVITTRGTPWQELPSIGAGWTIEANVDELINTLRAALTLPVEDLDEMGAAGRNWMQAEFSWDRVVTDFEHLYGWLMGAMDRPGFVVTTK